MRRIEAGLSVTLALLVVFAAPIADAAPVQRNAKVSPRLDLLASPAFRAVRDFAPRRTTTPVVLRLDRAPTTADLTALEAAGAKIARGSRGQPLGRGSMVTAELAPGAEAAVAALDFVRAVNVDGPPIRSPRPLDLTASLISADATWRSSVGEGAKLTGSGVTICDVDNGIDISHPLFFRADGGFFTWIDVDGSGKLEPGIDQVDLGGGPVTIRAMNGILFDRRTGEPMHGTEAPAFDPVYDYLYADENGDGRRNFGVAEGFSEQTPGYGERLFVLDDVNANGSLEKDEKLVALGTSKVKVFRIGDDDYVRGENLIEAPFDPEMLHGVGSSGVMVAGQPGFSRLVGMAPDADLVMATDNEGWAQVQMVQFCQQEGARVVLHEYAPWVGFHLDGSSDLEELIDDQSAEGVVHVNPAGNLSTSQKLYKKTVPSGSITSIPIEVPESLGASFMGLTFLWREPARDLQFTLTRPGGASFVVPNTPFGFQQPFDADLEIAGYRQDSNRGTAMVVIYLYTPGGPPAPVPGGTWQLDVIDPSSPAGEPFTLIGYVQDEASGWGLGMHFPEDSSEDHLIGWPGTADHGMAIAAFTGHDATFSQSPVLAATGERAHYSGRGRRIDDEPILWISAPDNPVVPARLAERELSYMIYGGTSGASPHVAGASALIVQADPNVTGDQVKEKIRAGAVSDAFTGAVPNEDYGNGKLDVHRAIFGEAAPAGSPPVVDDQAFTVAPGPSEITVAASDPDGGALTIEVDREYDGLFDETLSGAALALDLAEGTHVIKVRVSDPTGRTDQALLRVTAQPPGDDDVPDDDDGGRDDTGYYPAGGCAVRGAETASGAWLALAFGLAALRRRRARLR